MSLKAAFPLTSCTTELTPAVSRQPSSPNSRLEAYRESMEERGTKMLYLLTDHICFDERYGWEYLCDAMGEGEDTPSWMYRKSTE